MARFQTKPIEAAIESAASLPANFALTGLHAERERVTGEIIRLTAASTRLHAEATAGASLLDDLAKIAQAETGEMRAWADGGCKGAAPTGKLTEREAIATNIAAANATSAAAREALRDIDSQIKTQNDHLITINLNIENGALDALQGEFAELNSQHIAAVEQVRRLSAKLHGLRTYFGNEGRRHMDRGEQAKGSSLLARAEKISATKLANPGVTQGEIIEAANDWSRRAATLRNGIAS